MVRKDQLDSDLIAAEPVCLWSGARFRTRRPSPRASLRIRGLHPARTLGEARAVLRLGMYKSRLFQVLVARRSHRIAAGQEPAPTCPSQPRIPGASGPVDIDAPQIKVCAETRRARGRPPAREAKARPSPLGSTLIIVEFLRDARAPRASSFVRWATTPDACRTSVAPREAAHHGRSTLVFTGSDAPAVEVRPLPRRRAARLEGVSAVVYVASSGSFILLRCSLQAEWESRRVLLQLFLRALPPQKMHRSAMRCRVTSQAHACEQARATKHPAQNRASGCKTLAR